MSKIYTPLTIRGLELPNRIVVSPMCQYSSVNGMANDWHLVHLGSRAVGGAGLIITEAAAISPEGRITPSDMGIWSDEHIQPLKRITTFIKEQGTAVGIQLAHAGRKASTLAPWEESKRLTKDDGGWLPVAPSPIPFNDEGVVPKELSINEIRDIIKLFIEAAKRAVIAGFDVIEIHAAHGYLLNQFLSPLTNKRVDEYGGTFEKRVRLLLEVTEGIRSVIPDRMPLFVRISATEWAEGGHTIEDSLKISQLLKDSGVDLIDCSTGGVVKSQEIPVEKNYQVPFAEKIKKEINIATGAVGLIDDAIQADDILTNDQADLIFIGREMLRNPYFGLLSPELGGKKIAWPSQYQRAKPRK
ncbi:2,4-dienoyl-CoA reductase-like NADH-dependent reductase (Old Yellow Enzyme family) [Dokdonia sp. Hel_I_63]|uniref:NADH:flavin oxidoreductase/NADH oxidase n=1 Tax=Dokdonia sp. Hel_I_63 TaxID=1249996 RepID=UPI0011992525|nr:NADH:flavin oxidoreductase/NADH oxidase [Dokdonia sp. Hel_I_63]TVZ23016.1 2,4-dienoyl-CoA reductase-like NADH-dependent reductase (Old Yellow Enzyme family) [Dokdonia sp. Hel_I_63]